MEHLLDPVVLFFALGLAAGLLKSELRIPEALYETLSLYLLVAIGLKGGLQLQKASALEAMGPISAALFLGLLIPVLAFILLRCLGRFSVPDSAAIGAHYGSVSAVTFAVVLGTLQKAQIPYEGIVTVLMVMMEVPAILVGIFLSRWLGSGNRIHWPRLLHEVFLGKSIFLLMGAMLIGFLASEQHAEPFRKVFIDPFKGVLGLFLLEMGLVTSRRLRDLKKVGLFLACFAVMMPLLSGMLGAAAGVLCGLSLGGTIVLATLAASSSYIAAPAAVRVAIPEANPSFYLTASLGVTFPFNLTLGIPLYTKFSQLLFYWLR